MDIDSANGLASDVEGKEYKILQRLAVGGMAEIFLAEAINIHGFRKKVVIKRILPQYTSKAKFVDMFLDEARLVAKLSHPSIVQVFDIGQDAEGVFFAMEYIDGHDLRELLQACRERSRLLELDEVLAIAVPMAEALLHAHEARDDNGEPLHVIHRDISPSNAIVTTEGRVKLLDFGVAKSRAQARATTAASLKGKFGYMAPEQCKGLELDHRCDIFAFGVVLWELLTGRRLFPGGNEPAVLERIISEDSYAPSHFRPDLPFVLDGICLRSLARNRDDRYGSLRELLADLDGFAKAAGIHTTSRTLSTLIATLFPDNKEPTPSPLPGDIPSRSVIPLSVGGASRSASATAATSIGHTPSHSSNAGTNSATVSSSASAGVGVVSHGAVSSGSASSGVSLIGQGLAPTRKPRKSRLLWWGLALPFGFALVFVLSVSSKSSKEEKRSDDVPLLPIRALQNAVDEELPPLDGVAPSDQVMFVPPPVRPDNRRLPETEVGGTEVGENDDTTLGTVTSESPEDILKSQAGVVTSDRLGPEEEHPLENIDDEVEAARNRLDKKLKKANRRRLKETAAPDNFESKSLLD